MLTAETAVPMGGAGVDLVAEVSSVVAVSSGTGAIVSTLCVAIVRRRGHQCGVFVLLNF